MPLQYCDLIGECFVYIDDIIIYSKTHEDHCDHVAKVLPCLQEAGMLIKPSKCDFGLTEVPLLGYLVSGDGIKPQADKTEALRKMAVPGTVKAIHMYIDFWVWLSLPPAH